MAVLEGGVSALLAEVGLGVSVPQHVTQKPIPYGSLGHYRVTHQCTLAAAQVANARIFEVRNTHATNLIVPTRLVVKTAQGAAGTAQLNSLDIYKLTGFSAVDTVNTVTPTVSVKRGSMAAPPGAVAIRGVTVAGAAAGMTTSFVGTKDGGAFHQHPIVVQAAAQWVFNATDVFDDVNGTHPWVFVQNEGFLIENRILNVTSYGVTAYIDFSWVEVTLF
jgi:hypothetical protein